MTDASLIRAAQRGDRTARARIVTERMPMVRAVAARYRDLGLSLDDLVQEGSLGLLAAIDTYDVRRATDFDAYARFCIRRAVRNALTDQARTIRLPKQIVERRRALDRTEARLIAAGARVPTARELAGETGLSEDAVVEARGAASAGVSLDQPVLPDGSPLEAAVADASATDPERTAVDHEQAARLERAVARLRPRQQEIVRRHFGLGRALESMADVAADLHVSQQRARTIERDALYTLREQLEIRKE